MLQEVFYWMFNMSITASVTGVAVMLIRSVKRFPRRVAVFLWTVPFLRMILPFGLNSPYSLMSLLSKVTTKTVVVYQPTEDIAFSMTNSIMAANSYFPIIYKVNVLDRLFGAASVIWVIVALAILLMLSVTYITTVCEIKDATHLKDNVYLSEKVISPAVYGIVRPKIILPPSYADKDIGLVLLHEKTHIRSLDNLWRIVAFATAAVYWFNPLSWLFLKGFLTDLELTCDERVLSRLDNDGAKAYAKALLDGKQGTTLFASAFGGAKIRTRIENILSFKKMTAFSLILFVVLIAIIFYVLLTNSAL